MAWAVKLVGRRDTETDTPERVCQMMLHMRHTVAHSQSPVRQNGSLTRREIKLITGDMTYNRLVPCVGKSCQVRIPYGYTTQNAFEGNGSIAL